VIKTLNYIKTRQLKSRVLAKLCKEMGAQYQSLVVYCNSHWLSKKKVVVRVYSLQEGVAMFLEEENLLCKHFAMNILFLSQQT
jgi:tRNA/tmRNA/rRNA uracil-C5-methylase (TrmA/RlmC/RlmD family)